MIQIPTDKGLTLKTTVRQDKVWHNNKEKIIKVYLLKTAGSRTKTCTTGIFS